MAVVGYLIDQSQNRSVPLRLDSVGADPPTRSHVRRLQICPRSQNICLLVPQRSVVATYDVVPIVWNASGGASECLIPHASSSGLAAVATSSWRAIGNVAARSWGDSTKCSSPFRYRVGFPGDRDDSSRNSKIHWIFTASVIFLRSSSIGSEAPTDTHDCPLLSTPELPLPPHTSSFKAVLIAGRIAQRERIT